MANAQPKPGIEVSRTKQKPGKPCLFYIDFHCQWFISFLTNRMLPPPARHTCCLHKSVNGEGTSSARPLYSPFPYPWHFSRSANRAFKWYFTSFLHGLTWKQTQRAIGEKWYPPEETSKKWSMGPSLCPFLYRMMVVRPPDVINNDSVTMT